MYRQWKEMLISYKDSEILKKVIFKKTLDATILGKCIFKIGNKDARITSIVYQMKNESSNVAPMPS